MSDSFTFAHMADVHLGAYQKELRELNLQAFLKAMNLCLERKVAFVLIAGDLFHVNVPDLAVVDRAAAKLREVKEAGLPVYVWYGSHDYSPTEKSIIDVFASSGLFTKVAAPPSGEAADQPVSWTQDPATGAKMIAVAGKALGLDRHLYPRLDRAALEREEGFKIFGFHAGIKEFLPPYLAHIEAVPLEDLPKGFDYYAGGHIHHRIARQPEGFAPIVNPGPTFGSDGRDISVEEPRGLTLVDVREGRAEPRFEPLEVTRFLRAEIDVTGKTAQEARAAVDAVLGQESVDGRAVVLRVRGELSSGRRADLDLDALYTRLPKEGARAVHVIKSYSVREAQVAPGAAGAPHEIERAVLSQFVQQFGSADPRLAGQAGVELALALVRALSEEPPVQRGGKTDFEDRMRAAGLRILSLLDESPPGFSTRGGGAGQAPAESPRKAPVKSLEGFL